MPFVRRHLVQDRETGLFLGFEDGDIAPCRLVKYAVVFECEESAVMTAQQFCDSGYLLFSFFVEVEE